MAPTSVWARPDPDNLRARCDSSSASPRSGQSLDHGVSNLSVHLLDSVIRQLDGAQMIGKMPTSFRPLKGESAYASIDTCGLVLPWAFAFHQLVDLRDDRICRPS